MPPETEETTTEETTETTDETTSTEETTDAEVDNDAALKEEEEAELSPEQKAEKEKEARRTARVTAAEEAERKAEAIRKERAEQRAAQERADRIAARERALDAEIARSKAMNDELQRKLHAVSSGGPDALKALGLDYPTLTKKYLEEQDPEAIARAAIARTEALERQIRERDARDQQRVAEQQAEQQRRAFVELAYDNAEEFPHAATAAPRLLRTLADEAATEYFAEFGSYPNFAALLPRVDEKARREHEEVKQRSAKRARPGSEPSDGATATRDTTTNGQDARPPANRTLDSARAGTKATPRRQMTPEEEDEWALEQLRQARKADRKRDDAP